MSGKLEKSTLCAAESELSMSGQFIQIFKLHTQCAAIKDKVSIRSGSTLLVGMLQLV